MILVCPSCDTRYFTKDAQLGAEGRQVRCASCGHSWFVKPQEDGSPAEAENTGLTRQQVERLRHAAAANAMARTGPHSEIRAREASRRQRNRMIAAGLAWAAGFLVFAGLATTAIVFRNSVTDTWPRTASMYKMMGLEVNRFGLDFDGVDAKRSFDGTTPILTVSGWAINETESVRDAPKIHISLRDEDGDEIQSWTDNLSVSEIGPGERVNFSSQIVAPPVETFALSVSYVPGAGKVSETSEHHATVEDADSDEASGDEGYGDTESVDDAEGDHGDDHAAVDAHDEESGHH